MANEARLQEVYDNIKANPEKWDQSNYISKGSCGTTYCVAGWALLLAGTEVVDADGVEPHFDETLHHLGSHYAAADLLGLSEYQAEDLFEWIPYTASYNLDETYNLPYTPDGLAQAIYNITGVVVDEDVIDRG